MLRRFLVKGKFLLSVFALLLPAALSGQVAKPEAADAANAFSRYEVFAGVDYSGANQVLGASALIGGNVGGAAKLKRWFGGTVDFGDYGINATSHAHASPTVTTLMAGPEFYIPADNLTGFIHVLLGGAHTAGVGAQPDISFAYGVGGGFEYVLSKRFSLRVSGDDIISSFVQETAGQTGFSAHARSNARASAGVAYRF
jgi:hypothetical protein